MCSVIELQKPARPATGGVSAETPFTFREGLMPKSFLSFDDQIHFLTSKKNLTVNNPTDAKDLLSRIGYFSLIGGYKDPFKNPTTKTFKDGTSLEDIAALYRFDEQLRELYLKYILQVERHIRSLLSYYFAEKYGEDQSHYLSVASYRTEPRFAYDVTKLISDKLHPLACQPSNYPYIDHHRTTHGNVPLWVLVNALSFGTLSKFYVLLTPDLKSKISKHFEKVNEKQLEQHLTVMTKFRNVCAHNERLFSYSTVNDIPDTNAHRLLSIPQRGTQYVYGKRDLFALTISLRYLLSDRELWKFQAELSLVLSTYLGAPHAIPQNELLRYMGFPTNWTSLFSCTK